MSLLNKQSQEAVCDEQEATTQTLTALELFQEAVHYKLDGCRGKLTFSYTTFALISQMKCCSLYRVKVTVCAHIHGYFRTLQSYWI